MLRESERETLCRIAKALAAQFGSNCEVVVHEIAARPIRSSRSKTVMSAEESSVTVRRR